MKLLLLFVALFQLNQGQIDRAYDLHDQGLADSALSVLQTIDSATKDSSYYVARNLEAWIYMDKADRPSLNKGLEVLNQEIPTVPYLLTKTRIHS